MTDTQTPEVTARVEENWAALEVDGETQTIRADTEEEVRHEVLRRTMRIAAEQNTDVSLIATDRDGEWRLVVTPQGGISETANPTRAQGSRHGSERRAAPADVSDGTAESNTAGRGDTAQAPEPATADVDPTATTAPDPAAFDAIPSADRIPRWNDSEPSSPAEPRDASADVPESPADRGGPWAIDEDTVVRSVVAPSAPVDDRQAPTNPVAIIDPPPAVSAGDGGLAVEPVSIWDSLKASTPVTVEPALVESPPLAASDTSTETETDRLVPDEPLPDELAQPAETVVPEETVVPDANVVPEQPTTVPDPDEPPVTAEPPVPTDGGAPSLADAPSTVAAVLPTLADFQASQPPPVAGPATQGWRGAIRRGTGGLISPAPSANERRYREAVASVTRSLSGPRTICVINPKGGAHKTTATMLIAATFGFHRGGYTLAWDNNETRGTLGWRAHQSGHSNTAVDLLRDVDRFTDLRSARVGDLDNYVRSQAEAQFDVLASDEDAAASSMIDDEAFRRLHETLQRFYRIIVVDTGNNMRASNWEAAINSADQLVIVSAIREDTAGGAAWMVEGLAKKGHEAKLRDAVTVLSAPDKNVDAQLRTRLTDYFGSLTRDVVEVPYDPALVSGAGISMNALAPSTRDAWLMATATIANGL